MRRRFPCLVLAALAVTTVLPTGTWASTPDPTKPAATPGTPCDAGSRPETGVQGDIPARDVTSGRIKQGYFCNARLVSHMGSAGGYRVERYADKAGHVCAYFDSGTLFPNTIHPEGSGVWVLDMGHPSTPRLATTLVTPAMLSPHESLRLNQRRGLLAAALSNPASSAGFVDVYSVAEDCRAPKLLSSTPLGILGHESAFSPDGKTFYVTSILGMMSAVDLTNPALPSLLWYSRDYAAHGASVSDDGNTLFLAGGQGAFQGLFVFDVSQIQARKANPIVREISRLSWPEGSIAQNATPFRSRGHQYLIETDEFGGGSGPVGAARIINTDNLRRPRIVSHLRLAIHNQNDANKTAHYCTVPSRIDPAIIACGMLFSGLRVFDIRDVNHPREIAYANLTNVQESALYDYSGGRLGQSGRGVYSAPAYDPVHNDIWYADGSRGFFAIHLTRGSGITQFARKYLTPGS